MEIHHCDEKTSEQEVESKKSDRAITKEQLPLKLDDREDKSVEMTPRSKAEAVMQKAKLDEQQKGVVRKDLILSGLFSSQLKAKKQNQSKQGVKSTYSLISSAILKKYRLAKEVCSRTGLNKNTMSRYMRESKESKLEKAKDRFARKYEEEVLTFLERDDNSRSQPGKADKRKNENGETKQTRVLTDYLENLHMKYLSENPESSVSLSTFCRIRPKHLLRCEFITRNSCLCIKHQNMSLTVKLLHSEGICTCTNPESFVKEEFSVASAEEKLKDNISWPQWKRVAIKDKDVTKSVTRVVTSVVEKGTFLKEVVQQREEFQEHVERMTAQSHNSAAVLTFLDTMMPDMKSLVTDLSTVHYWTDSPTSQYRNKSMFDFVANHKSLYNCHAIWNYFEAGHGKGPCDGLGGTVKRMADIAMKSVKVVIQDATDFYSWAVQSSISNVKFKYVSDANINAKSESLKATCDTLKTVTGTMRVHAVVGLGNSQISVRETSCCCLVCIHDINTCGKWSDPRPTRKVNIPVAQTQSPETQAADPNAFPTTSSTSSKVVFDTQTNDCECNPADCPKSPHLLLSVNDFVAAVYDKNWYIGKVTDLDDDDDEAEISFMEFKKKTFQWPSIQDKLWLGRSAILCKIDAPAATGKSKRNKMFLISESDKAMVKSCFDSRL